MMKKERLDRRGFLGLAAAGAASLEGLAKSSSSAPEVRPTADEGLDFYDVSDWGVEGKGWTDTERYFDRLPSRAKAVVREPVWRLSRHSAGMLTRFETDATEIWVDYELLNERLEKPILLPPASVESTSTPRTLRGSGAGCRSRAPRRSGSSSLS